jgi:TIR domain
MSESYAFISYSRQDRQFVEHLTAELREAGVRTWTDLDNISAGEDWAREIDRGLLEATALIYVASKNSAQSRWMDAEYTAFIEKAKRVIPVVIDDDGAANLPPPLRRFQWVDFRGPFEPALRSLLAGTRDLRGTSPLAAATPKSKGYVFISYADEDAEFVAELKLFLKKQGYGYWDYRESQRDYQANYTIELENIIKNAAGTLSVVSPDWKRSSTALQELHFLREVETPVFLLKVKDPGPTLTISGMTYIDFRRNPKDGFTQLDGEMRRKGL